MGGSSFDLIAQELQKQHHIMEEMKAENRKLRQQLTDLRSGQGIFLEINGTRIALDQQITSTLSTTSPQPAKSASASAPIPPQDEKKSSEEHTPTAEQSNNKVGTGSSVNKAASDTTNVPQAEAEITRRPSTFLEEIMLDEFESALTAPTTMLHAPEPQAEVAQPEVSKEEQQAALRRELIGSFLLE